MRLWEWLHNLSHRKLEIEPEDLDAMVRDLLRERLEEMLEVMGPQLMARFLEVEGEGEDTRREARDVSRETRLER